MRINRRLAAIAAMLFVIVPTIIIANSTNTPPRNTGAPGDNDCATCHIGSVNPADGWISFEGLPGTYTPGTPLEFKMELESVAAEVFGMQATARPASDLYSGQAGRWSARNADTVVICQNGSTRGGGSCPSFSPLEFIQHSRAKPGAGFDVRWDPPVKNLGPIRIYVAMLGGTGDNTEQGDVTYTATRDLTYLDTREPPTITGVDQAWDYSNRASEGTFVVIWGENFGGTGRSWSGDDFSPSPLPGSGLEAGAVGPTALDDVEVLVNGVNAFVSYAGNEQINAVVAGGTGVGPANLEVRTPGGTSNSFSINISGVSPVIQEHPLWVEDEKKFAVVHAPDFSSYANKEELVRNADRPMSPGKPGNTVVIFALGCGPTAPVVPPGTVPAGGEPIAGNFEIRIGGMTAQAVGVLSTNVGLYQFNVTIPNLQPGDHLIELTVNGVTTGQGLYFTVGAPAE